jgi:hypothetical protein
MNNKDKTGVYYDATKNKKLMLVYDNGKLINQSEIIDEHEEDLIRDPLGISKKPEDIKEIASEEVYNSGMYSSENSLAYVSQFDNKYRMPTTPKEESNRNSNPSNQGLIAENYIDNSLLAMKSKSLDSQFASGLTYK